MNDRSGKVRMSHNTQTLQWTKPMGMTIVLILLAAVLVRYFHEPQELSPVVTVSGGKLQGVVSYSRNGNKIYEFLSVPYAKKPVGNLRFEVCENYFYIELLWVDMFYVSHLDTIGFSLQNLLKNGKEFCKCIKSLRNAFKLIW